MPSRIVRVPNKDTRDTRVHPRCHQKSHTVFSLCRVNISHSSVACNGDGKSEEHNNSSEFDAVGEEGDDYGQDGGYGVGNDCPELDLVRVGGEATFVDNGRKLGYWLV